MSSRMAHTNSVYCFMYFAIYVLTFWDSQAFVSDHGSNLFALDLRNGRVSYGYKGLAGAVTAMSSCPSFLASASEDRFLRFHSTFAPSAQVGQQQEHKGEVLDKLYIKVKPTAVVWDRHVDINVRGTQDQIDGSESEGDVDDVWDRMEDIGSDGQPDGRKKTRAV